MVRCRGRVRGWGRVSGWGRGRVRGSVGLGTMLGLG